MVAGWIETQETLPERYSQRPSSASSPRDPPSRSYSPRPSPRQHRAPPVIGESRRLRSYRPSSTARFATQPPATHRPAPVLQGHRRAPSLPPRHHQFSRDEAASEGQAEVQWARQMLELEEARESMRARHEKSVALLVSRFEEQERRAHAEVEALRSESRERAEADAAVIVALHEVNASLREALQELWEELGSEKLARLMDGDGAAPGSPSGSDGRQIWSACEPLATECGAVSSALASVGSAVGASDGSSSPGRASAADKRLARTFASVAKYVRHGVLLTPTPSFDRMTQPTPWATPTFEEVDVEPASELAGSGGGADADGIGGWRDEGPHIVEIEGPRSPAP